MLVRINLTVFSYLKATLEVKTMPEHVMVPSVQHGTWQSILIKRGGGVYTFTTLISGPAQKNGIK